MTLGEKIRQHREALGLTLEQLSDLSGVEVGTISALENRRSSRSMFASKIAKGLGITVEQLFADGEDEKKYMPSFLRKEHIVSDSVAPPYKVEIWPFEDIDRARFDRLSPRQKGRVEQALIDMLDKIEAEQSSKDPRRA